MNLIWYPVSGPELPDALKDQSKVERLSGGVSLLSSDTVLGMSNIDQGGGLLASTILVGPGRSELFSWVSTYAEEMFPLTQFCRVCSKEDWADLNLQHHAESALGSCHPIWSSLVLGEMLGQSDADIDVAGAPLARASACFSFAIARTALLYPGHKAAKQKCIQRLAMTDREPRFVRRHITVESLTRVWTVAMSLQAVPDNSISPIETVVQVVSSINKNAAQLLLDNESLLSDSAEDRVVGFDSVADSLFDKRKADLLGREGVSLGLAAAALLAGRGTSHIQLLAPTAKLFPESLVWFGLLSGALGSRSWDKAWMQQTKGIERSLRQFFRPDEPVSADICWPEYEWLSQTYDSLEALSTIPKNAPKSLAIELLPGVNCQFRLVGPERNTAVNDESRTVDAVSKISSSVITADALTRTLHLLAAIQQILQPQIPATPPQGFLFANDSPQKSNRPARRKTIKPQKASGQ